MRHIQLVLFVLAGAIISMAYQNCADDFQLENFEQSSVAAPVTGNAKEITEEIFGHLSSASLAQATLSDTQNTSTFECLYKPGQTCLSGAAISKPLRRIYSGQNSFFLDNLDNPHRGLDSDGRPCNTFMNLNNNIGLNDPNCQVRIEVLWEPTCSGGGLNCANANIVHKFKIRHVEFVPARESTVVETEDILPNSQLFAFRTFSNDAGAGIYLRSQTTASAEPTNVAKYQSCLGSLIFNTTQMNCNCAANYTKDLDNPLKCVATTRNCSVLNAAACTETYNASSNTYAITTLTCNTGYKRSGNTCIIDSGNWVALTINTAAFNSATCTQFYTITFSNLSTQTPTVGSVCSPLDRVQCYGFVSTTPISKFKCQ